MTGQASSDPRLLGGLAELLRTPLSVSEAELFTRAIDLAVEVTGSRIGYLHYVNTDQDTIELGTWSTSTLGFCSVVNDRHYPISAAGVWADTFRNRRAEIHNDYAAAPNRRGLPEGHAPVLRLLGVPVIEGDMVRLLLGVGNKPDPYTEADAAAIQQIGDDTWLMTSRLRQHHGTAADLDLLRQHHGRARLGTWEWDPHDDHLTVGPVVRAILGLTPDGPNPLTWPALLALLEPASADALQQILTDLRPGSPLDVEVRGPDPAGGTRILRITGTWQVPREGQAEVLQGTMADISLEERAHQATFDAEHDPLTGLLNRRGLMADLESRAAEHRRRAWDEFAVIFVDLDDFKAVNDTHGHLVGDEVLRACGQRLAAAVRSQDRVARLGGDEFVIVQTHGPDRDSIRRLAASVVAALAEPIPTSVGPLRVMGSAGAATSVDTLPGIEALLARADGALYEAKRRGGNLVVVAERP